MENINHKAKNSMEFVVKTYVNMFFISSYRQQINKAFHKPKIKLVSR